MVYLDSMDGHLFSFVFVYYRTFSHMCITYMTNAYTCMIGRASTHNKNPPSILSVSM